PDPRAEVGPVDDAGCGHPVRGDLTATARHIRASEGVLRAEPSGPPAGLPVLDRLDPPVLRARRWWSLDALQVRAGVPLPPEHRIEPVPGLGCGLAHRPRMHRIDEDDLVVVAEGDRKSTRLNSSHVKNLV